MLTPSPRRLLLPVLLLLALVVPSEAAAATTAQDLHLTAYAGGVTNFQLTALGDSGPFGGQLVISVPPSSGTIDESAPTNCTPGGDCTKPVSFTVDPWFTGTVTTEYYLEMTPPSTHGIVTIDVVPPVAPILPAAPTAQVGATWTTAISGVLPDATVDYGDQTGTHPLDAASDGTATLTHVYAGPGTFTITVTNAAFYGSGSATTHLLVTSVVPTPPSFTVSPLSPPLLLPGLYVHVIDGLIIVTSTGGTHAFQAGQFGYVASTQQPPVVVPPNPGIRFTPPPAFAPPQIVSASKVQLAPDPASTKSPTVQIGFSYPIDGAAPSGGRSRRAHAAGSAATPAPAAAPELWYIAPDGSMQPVISSTAPGATSGVDAASGRITATFDATSTPSVASLAKETGFIVIRRAVGRAQPALRRTSPARTIGWPSARTTVSTGARFTCPTGVIRPCVVRLRAVSTQLGVRRLVGQRTMHVRAGATAPLDFTLLQAGRWRIRSRGLVASLDVAATAWQPRVAHDHRTYDLRVRLPH